MVAARWSSPTEPVPGVLRPRWCGPSWQPKKIPRHATVQVLGSNAEGKEMILRFAAESDIDTSYAAWRLRTPLPYSIRAVTKVRAVKLSMEQWVRFIEQHPAVKNAFELEIMRLMSEVMAHTITLHLLDAPGRVQRFMRKHAALAERLPKKELALYLNLSPETLSRLKRHGKI